MGAYLGTKSEDKNELGCPGTCSCNGNGLEDGLGIDPLSIATGAVGIIKGINKGTCGKKCYGFGKMLRKCRDRRKADCERMEREKKEAAAHQKALEEARKKAIQEAEEEARRQAKAAMTPAVSPSQAGFKIPLSKPVVIGGGLALAGGIAWLMFKEGSYAKS